MGMPRSTFGLRSRTVLRVQYGHGGSTAVTQGRALVLRDRHHAAALQEARQRQPTPAWTTAYARRAGMEGTIAQGVRIGDRRRSRYRGLVNTRVFPDLIASALTVVRVAAWFGQTLRSQTRPSACAALAGTYDDEQAV